MTRTAVICLLVSSQKAQKMLGAKRACMENWGRMNVVFVPWLWCYSSLLKWMCKL